MEHSLELRWVRSTNSRVFAGVCGGVAQALSIQAWVVRLLWLLAVLFVGAGVLLYIMCIVAFPRADRKERATQKMILGVCARIHKRGDLEVGLARLVALLLLFASFGAAIVGYIVLHFILEEPRTYRA